VVPLDFLFQEAVEPLRGLATDRHLLNGFHRAAKSPSAILRAYTIAGERISAGRFHRLGPRALERSWRRLSGGRAAAFGDGMIGFSLLLPHRAALVAGDPFALAPYQIPNRYVRGLLRGLRAIGVDAFYPGRDFVTVNRKTIGMVTFDVDERGALLFEGMIALDRPFELRHAAELSGESDGGIQQEIFSREITTSLAAELGREVPAREVCEALATGYAEQFKLEVHRRELSALEEQAIRAIETREFGEEWTRGSEPRSGLDHRAVTPIALGTFEARVAIEQGRFLRDVHFAGDFIASASAVEALERDLRLCPADWGSIAMVADRIFAVPESFILGIGKIRTIPDTILRAIAG
jgi:lipoate-protein ligase A